MFRSVFFLLVLGVSQSVWASDYQPSFANSKQKVRIEINAAGQSTIHEERCMKVLTNQSISSLGERRISYISTMESLEVTKAYTVMPSGERIPVEKDRILLQDGDGEGDSVIQTDIKSVLIVYPRVDVGSILCHQLVNIQSKPFFGKHFSWAKYFSPHYASEDFELEIIAAPSAGVQVAARGLSIEPPQKTSDGNDHWKIAFKSLSALPSETFQVSYRDFAPFVSVSTLKDYSELAQVYKAGLSDKLEPSPAIKAQVQELIKGMQDDVQKVAVIHNWISRNIRYLAIYWADGGFVPHKASEIFQNRYGDCKDHALLLEVMLKEAGIESTAVLIHTEKNFVLPKVPLISAFNHVITYVPSLDAYMDSTANFAPMGVLPVEMLDKHALHVKEGVVRKTGAGEAAKESTLTMTKMNLNSDGSISGEAISMASGHFDYRLRGIRFADQGKSKEAIAERYLGRYLEKGQGLIQTSDPENFTQLHEFKSSFDLEPLVNVPGPSALAIPVGLVVGWNKGISLRDQIQKASYPFTCPPQMHKDQIQLRLPKGVKITRLPKDIAVESGPFRYSAFYTTEGQVIHAERTFVVNGKSVVCAPELSRDFNLVLRAMRNDMRSQIFID